jgi:bla regulator protein BlaR1
MKTRFQGAVLWMVAACGLCGQPAQTPLSFEVASIKPSAPDERRMFLQLQPGGGLRVTNMTFKQILAFAYDVRDFQISGGPGWITSDRYNIQAHPEHASDDQAAAGDIRNMTDEQRKTLDQQVRERMRTLLADRFQLAMHRETKESPVYALVVAKGGSKLKENTDASGGRQGLGMRRGQLTGTAAPLPMLATVLSNMVGRPVIDKTGLTGKYDFELQWTPDPGQTLVPGALSPGPDAPPPPDPNGPTLFTAVQEQLGLRLESQKGPVDLIVIDGVEKPSEN